MDQKILELKDLAASYEAALYYDYCPEPDDASKIPSEVITNFTADNFRRGAEENAGMSAGEIARLMIDAISNL